jgi:hypothetical protein
MEYERKGSGANGELAVAALKCWERVRVPDLLHSNPRIRSCQCTFVKAE